MDNKIKFILMGVVVFSITSCAKDDSDYPSYPSYDYDNTQSSISYNDTTYDDDYKHSQKQDVVVPNSYHVGELHSPVSFKDRDQTWVNNQNPQGYTIELAEGDKASQVAQVLYKTPKGDRMAQVKYERDGKVYYKGVYGTYHSSEEAQKALNALPPEIKSSAAVINWSTVQQ